MNKCLLAMITGFPILVAALMGAAIAYTDYPDHVLQDTAVPIPGPDWAVVTQAEQVVSLHRGALAGWERVVSDERLGLADRRAEPHIGPVQRFPRSTKTT